MWENANSNVNAIQYVDQHCFEFVSLSSCQTVFSVLCSHGVCMSVWRACVRACACVCVCVCLCVHRKPFLSAHVLFYTQLFVQVLPRFLRMDFSVARNLYMFSRVCKVGVHTTTTTTSTLSDTVLKIRAIPTYWGELPPLLPT